MAGRLNHARYVSSHSDFVHDPGPEWDLPFVAPWRRHAHAAECLLTGNPAWDDGRRRLFSGPFSPLYGDSS